MAQRREIPTRPGFSRTFFTVSILGANGKPDDSITQNSSFIDVELAISHARLNMRPTHKLAIVRMVLELNGEWVNEWKVLELQYPKTGGYYGPGQTRNRKGTIKKL